MIPKLVLVLPLSAMASWWGIVKVGGPPMAIGASNVDTQRHVLWIGSHLVLTDVVFYSLNWHL
jgi:hypothetical protein